MGLLGADSCGNWREFYREYCLAVEALFDRERVGLFMRLGLNAPVYYLRSVVVTVRTCSKITRGLLLQRVSIQ